MPLIDPNLASTWDNAYTDGYSRANTRLVEIVKEGAAGARIALGVPAGQTIAMFGSGFGWEAEEWQAAGLGPIVAVDFSTWIHANKPGNATVTILNEDGTTATSQRNIKQAGNITGNNKFGWGVSMDMLPWLTDQECVKYASVARDICTQVAHIITCPHPDPYVNPPAQGNWKTLTQWKALLTPDLVCKRVAPHAVL